MGICAGYYLAHGIMKITPRYRRAFPHGLRGDGNATVALTPYGAKVLHKFGLNETFLSKGNRELVFYANGATYGLTEAEAAAPNHQMLLTFDSQVPIKANKEIAKKIKRGDTGKGFAASALRVLRAPRALLIVRLGRLARAPAECASDSVCHATGLFVPRERRR